MRESHAHDIEITREAPNYSRNQRKPIPNPSQREGLTANFKSLNLPYYILETVI